MHAAEHTREVSRLRGWPIFSICPGYTGKLLKEVKSIFQMVLVQSEKFQLLLRLFHIG